MTSSNESISGNNASPPKSDFSIEHILTKAGNRSPDIENPVRNGFMEYSWLHCTRYCPPKLPRSQKKDGPQKRQLGRHPRIPFSSQQLAVLEDKFKKSPYLSSAEVTHLSRSLQLADIRVKIWFQNRRARERRERNDQETQQLKPYSNDLKPKIPTSSESQMSDHTISSTHPNIYYNLGEAVLPLSTHHTMHTSPSVLPPTQLGKQFWSISCFLDPSKL